MRVTVRIRADVRTISTSALQAIIWAHTHDKLRVDLPIDQLYELLGELFRRRSLSGSPYKSDAAAWRDFLNYYMPACEDPFTPHELTPSPDGRECLGNGEWPGYACCCDECDYALQCLPQFG